VPYKKIIYNIHQFIIIFAKGLLIISIIL